MPLRSSPSGTPPSAASGPGTTADIDSDLTLRENISLLERRLLLEAHRRSNGVRREAARLLGIDPRNLGYYFRKHGLDPDALPV